MAPPAPIELHPSLQKVFGDQPIRMLQFVDKLNSRGSKDRRILAATSALLFMTDAQGKVHRVLDWAQIEEVVTQGTGAGSQALIRLSDEPDIVLAWADEPRNAHTSPEAAVEAMLACAAPQKQIPLRKEEGDGGLRGLARQKGRTKVSPKERLRKLSDAGPAAAPPPAAEKPADGSTPPAAPEAAPPTDAPPPDAPPPDAPGAPPPAAPAADGAPPPPPEEEDGFEHIPSSRPPAEPAQPPPAAAPARDAAAEEPPTIVVSGPDADELGVAGEYEPSASKCQGHLAIPEWEWEQRGGGHRIVAAPGGEDSEEGAEPGVPVWHLRKDAGGPPLLRCTGERPGAAGGTVQRRDPDGSWRPARIGLVQLPAPPARGARTPPEDQLWEVYPSQSRPGRVYYYCPSTDESRWELPTGWCPPPVSPLASPRKPPKRSRSPTAPPPGPSPRRSAPWGAFVREFNRGLSAYADQQQQQQLPQPAVHADPAAAGTDASALESVARYEVHRRPADLVAAAAAQSPDWAALPWAERLGRVRAYEAGLARGGGGSPPPPPAAVTTGPPRPIGTPGAHRPPGYRIAGGGSPRQGSPRGAFVPSQQGSPGSPAGRGRLRTVSPTRRPGGSPRPEDPVFATRPGTGYV
eukprot:TRINITY_DN12040_c0_g1_i2.p1 TRINITY_DN12040_c0_g1~~TRINITY_DN12040_c0_g1_i2.p1  ORF type:complete len:633 (+),score=157.45 TRINITY_DN12040_c0_g1_i2:91-1989(+)